MAKRKQEEDNDSDNDSGSDVVCRICQKFHREIYIDITHIHLVEHGKRRL